MPPKEGKKKPPGLIASIKRQLEEMEAAKMRADKICREATAEAKKLREPLELATVDNKELKRQMANYDRDKASLRAKIKVLAKLEKQYEILKWEYEGLEVQFDRLLPQRDALKSRFTRSVMQVKDKLSEEAVKLEAKLKAVQMRDLVPIELQELLRLKDAQVEDLRYETARLHKAHDDLLATYEVKLAKLGVPPDELGFQPLKPITVAGKSPIIGLGPANLVTKNK